MIQDLLQNVKEVEHKQSCTREQAAHTIHRLFKKLLKELRYKNEKFHYLADEIRQDRRAALNAIRNGKDVEYVIFLARNVIMDYRLMWGHVYDDPTLNDITPQLITEV